MNRPRVWALSDGAAGNLRQALALAGALGEVTRNLQLTSAPPWRWLAPRKLPLARFALGSGFAAALADTPPDLAIGCGRQAALATRLLRERGVPVVQLLAPRLNSRHWSLLVAPAHDCLSGDNVITTVGSLHEVDDRWLARARGDWPQFGELPSPRCVVLLGGPTAAAALGQPQWRQLVARMRHWHRRDGGSLLLSSSRRTPAWLREAARRDLAALPGVQWHGTDDGPNPYAGLLGWADRIVVSADSVNLLSEACATRVPVQTLLPKSPRGRLLRFHRSLLASKRLTDLSEEPPATVAMDPLRELAAVADAVRARLGWDRSALG